MTYAQHYRPGSLEVRYVHSMYCDEGDSFETHEPIPDCCTPAMVITLPHQCDAFGIGTIEDAEALLADLTVLVAQLKMSLDIKIRVT